jgi:hypothetical protein
MSMELSVAGRAGMPVLRASTEHVLHPVKLHTPFKVQQGFSRRRRNPFKFAHLSKDHSTTFESQDDEWSAQNRVGKMLYAPGEA